MSEVKLGIAALGTREEVRKIKATLAVTQGADTTTTLAVVFENPYVEVPEIIGVVCNDAAALEATFNVDSVDEEGMNVNAYQVLAANLVTGNYVVEVTLAGWKAA